jgi:hypothetical protein
MHVLCEEFNESNKTRLVKRIDDLKDMDICYEKDPLQPILVSLKLINALILLSFISMPLHLQDLTHKTANAVIVK